MSTTGKRRAEIKRKTGETDIALRLLVDGGGKSSIATGIPFFDHMLTLFAKHALFDLDVKVKGDLEVDFHHTVEDTGIVLGQALARALGDKKGLVRYGNFLLPMDETLVRVALDFSARPLLVWRAPKGANLDRLRAGDFPAQLTVEFLRAFAQEAGLTLHVEVLYSSETHHLIEAVFKGIARAIEQAVRRDPRVKGIPSTKGML
jgi:imidazoleglycerol-phosphate dehydratase